MVLTGYAHKYKSTLVLVHLRRWPVDASQGREKNIQWLLKIYLFLTLKLKAILCEWESKNFLRNQTLGIINGLIERNPRFFLPDGVRWIHNQYGTTYRYSTFTKVIWYDKVLNLVRISLSQLLASSVIKSQPLIGTPLVPSAYTCIPRSVRGGSASSRALRTAASTSFRTCWSIS